MKTLKELKALLNKYPDDYEFVFLAPLNIPLEYKEHIHMASDKVLVIKMKEYVDK